MWKPRFRFGLKTLLIGMTLFAIVFGVWGNLLYRKYRETRALEALQESGAQFEKIDDRIVRVYLGGATWNDEQIKSLVPHLSQLGKLRELDFVRVGLTDAGVDALAPLQRLEEVYVFETGLTSAGIQRLDAEILPTTRILTEEPDPIASRMAAAIIYPHAIVALAWSPAGDSFASGSGDGKIRLWNIHLSKPVAEWRPHSKWTFAIKFSPNGKMIATGGGDSVARLWDAKTHQLLGQFVGHTDDIHAIAFTPDGLNFVTASDDRSIRVWDLKKYTTVRVLTGHEAQIPSMDVSPDGKQIASASRDDTVRVWDLESGTPLARLDSESGDALAVAFQAKGHKLAAAGKEGDIQLWDLKNFQSIKKLAGDDDPIYRLAFHPTDERLVSGGENGVRFDDLETGMTRKLGGQEKVSCVAFHPHGKLLASANAAGEIRLFDHGSLETLKIFRTMYGERGLELQIP